MYRGVSPPPPPFPFPAVSRGRPPVDEHAPKIRDASVTVATMATRERERRDVCADRGPEFELGEVTSSIIRRSEG